MFEMELLEKEFVKYGYKTYIRNKVKGSWRKVLVIFNNGITLVRKRDDELVVYQERDDEKICKIIKSFAFENGFGWEKVGEKINEV